jgi:hypothetical protein
MPSQFHHLRAPMKSSLFIVKGQKTGSNMASSGFMCGRRDDQDCPMSGPLGIAVRLPDDCFVSAGQSDSRCNRCCGPRQGRAVGPPRLTRVDQKF